MISVIVPVYNVETYLPTCIESILDQTYKDFEILLIDDGSTDNSGKICDEYAKRDNRCIAIHQQNKGVYNARNTGLNHATGEYISFVDSDDYIHPQMLEILYEALQKGDYDFSMITYKKVFNKSEIIDISETCINTISLNRDTLISGLYNKTHISESNFQAVWNKLYKKALLKDMLFKLTGSEDTEFNNRIYLKAQSAIFINLPLYYWLQRSNSISHQSKNLIDRGDTYILCLNEIPQINIRYRAYCLEKIYKIIINIRYLAQKTQSHHCVIEFTKKLKNQTINEFLRNKHINIFLKIGLLTFYYIPITYNIFINILEFKSKRIK